MTIRRDSLAQKHRLSERQRLALGHVLEHGELMIPDFEKMCPKTSRRTLQRDLKSMVEKGLLRAEGATNQQCYRLV